MYHFECNADSKKEMISRLMKQIFMIEPDFIKKSFADYDEVQTAKGGQAEVLVMPKIMGIIDEEIKVDTKMNEIFDTDAWWWHKRTNEEFESQITRVLKRIKEKIAKEK